MALNFGMGIKGPSFTHSRHISTPTSSNPPKVEPKEKNKTEEVDGVKITSSEIDNTKD